MSTSVIPGFGSSDLSTVNSVGITTTSSNSTHEYIPIQIPLNHEWRIEVPFKSIFKFKITRGIAEIFGTELPLNVELQLYPGAKCAIYSPIETTTVEYMILPNRNDMLAMSNDDQDTFDGYLSGETGMTPFLNLHIAIEAQRQQINDYNILNESKLSGPRVLVIGNKFSGKTSLCKILASYANKMNNTPILVNLNPRDGVFALPGSLTATPISDSFDLECSGGWGFSTTSGTLSHNPKQPIVKNYGFGDFKENLDLYKYQISQLGIAVLSRLEEDIQVNNSGIIVDTPALDIKDFGIIESIVSDFRINIIVVMGSEKLMIDLKKKFKHKSTSLDIVKVPKSTGVVELEDSYIRRLQEECIKEYFNGNYKTRLSPFKTDIDVQDLIIYKGVITKELISTLSFLPAGDSYTVEEDNETKQEENLLEKYYSLLEQPSSSNLDNSIMAITHVPQTTSKTNSRALLNSSVLGYVHVSKFDDEKKKLKVLLPFPGIFPRNILISTNIGFNE